MHELNEKDIEAIQFSIKILFKQHKNYDISYNETKALYMRYCKEGQILNKIHINSISYLIESLENYMETREYSVGVDEYLTTLLWIEHNLNKECNKKEPKIVDASDIYNIFLAIDFLETVSKQFEGTIKQTQIEDSIEGLKITKDKIDNTIREIGENL